LNKILLPGPLPLNIKKNKMEKLNDKVALITGGTSGIGLATAKEFIEEGATVIITGRNQQKINDTVQRLGPKAFGFVSDAGSLSDILKMTEMIKKHSNKIDILFVNAGYGKFAPIELVEEANFDELFNVLVKGTFFTVKQIMPMINEGGSIILNTSVVTETGSPNMSIYAAAKSAVQSFIKTFAAEFTARKIRVNGISPGYIATNIFNNTGMSPKQIADAIENTIPALPLKRFGKASEIAKTIVFLASDDASYIHATEITVDGGLTKIKL
jgi:NAD(P)-dependent dehydrogenase (short-subunit alcohol dehydrogenase family)